MFGGVEFLFVGFSFLLALVPIALTAYIVWLLLRLTKAVESIDDRLARMEQSTAVTPAPPAT